MRRGNKYSHMKFKLKTSLKQTNKEKGPGLILVLSLLQVNICSDAPDCGPGMAGCVLEDGRPVSPVGVEKSLQYSTDGLLKLTYKGPLDSPTGI